VSYSRFVLRHVRSGLSEQHLARLERAEPMDYSNADTNALHVRLADEAVNIGAAPARESYDSF
jgi:biotin carboxylase